MLQTDSEFTKTRWICTVIGLGFYLVDIVTDVGLAVKYFLVGDLVWSGLTLVFVVVGSAVTQVFSYSWYRDDMRKPLVNSGRDGLISGMNRRGLIGLHVTQTGIFTRYVKVLGNIYGYYIYSQLRSDVRLRCTHASTLPRRDDEIIRKSFSSLTVI